MDITRADCLVMRCAALRESLERTRQKAHRAIDSARTIQHSDITCHVMAQRSLQKTRHALRQSTALID